jgi:hypothetical protein
MPALIDFDGHPKPRWSALCQLSKFWKTTHYLREPQRLGQRDWWEGPLWRRD